jgi:hypothetical protein
MRTSKNGSKIDERIAGPNTRVASQSPESSKAVQKFWGAVRAELVSARSPAFCDKSAAFGTITLPVFRLLGPMV